MMHLLLELEVASHFDTQMRATCQDYLVALPSAEMDDCLDLVFEYFAEKIDILEQHLALSDQASVTLLFTSESNSQSSHPLP
jgi:hypothetical protein